MTRSAKRTCLAWLVLVPQLAGATASEPKEATPPTRAAQARVLASLPFEDAEDFNLAQRGLLARPRPLVIKNAEGRVVWDLASYAFLTGQGGGELPASPDTVNPSQWRQAQLNMHYGLYRVIDGIYQVRGYDLANITFVKTRSGWVVFDPLTSQETAAAALALVNEYLGVRPVKAVVYSHSHVDHFGGVKGVVSAADVESGRVQIIAPAGFMHAAINENILAGNVMTRRAAYQYGTVLARGPRGQIDSAIGKAVAAGTVTLIAPTIEVSKTPTKIKIDGLKMIFQFTPDTEAPAEMNTWFPDLKALWTAENCTGTLHNLYTLRGAEVRDASAWSKYVNETLELFGAEAEVVFASHNWPRWGNAAVVDYLKKQRDLYGYLHDQTLRLANHGYTMVEIAEMLEVPPILSHDWFNRGYHGTYNHDIKAVYQKYLGWYDGNPANLHPLPPAEEAKKYVEYMGGAAKVLEMARRSYEAGEYRWVATVVNHVVFADPENQEARQLQADVLEQLGYQAEGAGWRNSYLAAAAELRDGVPGTSPRNGSPDVLRSMTLPMVFDYMGVRLDGPRAAGVKIYLNFVFPDLDERYAVSIENAHLSYVAGRLHSKADATFTLDRPVLDRLQLGLTTLDEQMAAGNVKVEGDLRKFEQMMGLMDRFELWFDIVTP